jgi:hypothetical protein
MFSGSLKSSTHS